MKRISRGETDADFAEQLKKYGYPLWLMNTESIDAQALRSLRALQ